MFSLFIFYPFFQGGQLTPCADARGRADNNAAVAVCGRERDWTSHKASPPTTRLPADIDEQHIPPPSPLQSTPLRRGGPIGRRIDATNQRVDRRRRPAMRRRSPGSYPPCSLRTTAANSRFYTARQKTTTSFLIRAFLILDRNW